MAKMPADIRSLCRAYTEETVRIVAGIVRSESTPPAVRVQGAAMLWDRGWGRAPQSHTGADGEGAIAFTIRHIIEAGPAPTRTIEHAPIGTVPNGTGEE
jgi:hypothetical protein